MPDSSSTVELLERLARLEEALTQRDDQIGVLTGRVPRWRDQLRGLVDWSVHRWARPFYLGDNGGMPVIAGPEAVREIDVIAVDLDLGRYWGQWGAVPGDVIGTWTNDQVDEVLDLVAALPEGKQMRCFVPRFAVRLRSGPLVLAEVAFCFRCHNAMGIPSPHSPKTPRWFTFDPNSEPVQELLHRFRALDPLNAAD